MLLGCIRDRNEIEYLKKTKIIHIGRLKYYIE